MAFQGNGAPSGFFYVDRPLRVVAVARVAPLPGLATRIARAGAVAFAWAASALPAAAGWQRCPMAAFAHRPCPGCGMTRAIKLLLGGDLEASLRMHPLAMPMVGAGCVLVASTVWLTAKEGTPFCLHRRRFGRVAIAFAVAVYAATFALWVARWFGLFGGPVAV